MPRSVRAGSLLGYVALAQSLGANVDRELERVGLSMADLADPENPIPFVAQIDLLEHTAIATRCPGFGLKLSQLQDVGILGPVAPLIRHAATVRDAIEAASSFAFIHSPAMRLRLEESGDGQDEFDISFSLQLPRTSAAHQTIELALGLIAHSLRLLTCGAMRPLMALVPHAAVGPVAGYQDILGCECSFGAKKAAIRYAAQDLQFRLPEHNPFLLELARTYINQRNGLAGASFADSVKRVVGRLLGSSEISQQLVAAKLNIHGRTLQRRLSQEGHQFEDIVDEGRRELFVELLNNERKLSMGQITVLVGYSEQSTLARSCKRWFGCSPTELARKRLENKDPFDIAGAEELDDDGIGLRCAIR